MAEPIVSSVPVRLEVQPVVEGEGVYKCVCRWHYCCVLDGCLLSLNL